jgi:hypothetical protein
MKSYELPRRVLALLALLGLVMAGYVLWARPYQLHWGATDEEIQRPMPGDELKANPSFLATRAITIAGTPEQIWPWLLQMGYTRAGFYGYDIVENLGSPRGLRSADTILPEFQNLRVGDAVPISPAGGMVFYAIEPPRYLIWSGGSDYGGFTWALYPVDANYTRLVSRIRWSYRWTQPALLSLDVLTEFTDHLAVRKILQGVKDRVEGHIEPMLRGNIEFFIYLGSAIVFVWGAVTVLLVPLTWRSWRIGLASGVVWLITWYAPESIWIGAVLDLILVWAIRVEMRRHARARAA